MDQETFEIVENVTVLREAETGWTRELSKVRWYKKEPTIDIRWWSPNKKKAGKGVSLTQEEAVSLFYGLQECLGLTVYET
ncbi:MAG: PC4/YdbC family ssDNA-binding protein [Lysinibacillus sp.]